MFNAKDCVLLWNPGTDQVAVHRKPLNGAGAGYSMSGLGCYSIFAKTNFVERQALVFIEAMHLIVRDGCDPKAVHTALLQVREYHDGLAEDMPGVDRG